MYIQIQTTKLHCKTHPQQHAATLSVPDAKFLQASRKSQLGTGMGERPSRGQQGRRGRRAPQASAALQLPFPFVLSRCLPRPTPGCFLHRCFTWKRFAHKAFPRCDWAHQQCSCFTLGQALSFILHWNCPFREKLA